MIKLCVLTGTRAEYGILKGLIKEIYDDKEIELQLLVTGTHLSPEFGLTYKEIEKDGYPISYRVEMVMSSETPNGVAKSMGVGMIGFADAFTNLKPDMVIILGDRYEAMAAATAAMVHRIPIAHIHGGELTEGLIDEAIRHSISKMSYLHFTSTEDYRRRVIQLGEQPERVYNVGALGVENIKSEQLLLKSDLEKRIHFKFDSKIAMVTYHPVTLEVNTAIEQFSNLLLVLERKKDYHIIFTKSNADMEGRSINYMIDDFVEKYSERAIAFTSMGQLNYLSALKYCSIVVGNSSSGIIEAPSFAVPTINIGNRQNGRVKAESVIDCDTSVVGIEEAFCKAEEEEFRKKLINGLNPHEKENTGKNIVNIIKDNVKAGINIQKKFYDLEA